MSGSGAESLKVFSALPLAPARSTKPADMQPVEL